MAFIYRGGLRANSSRYLVGDATNHVLAASTAFTVGDAVAYGNTDGVLDLAGAGNPVYGIIVGFKNGDGTPVTSNGAGGDFTDTYTTAASNSVYAIVDVSKESLYSVTADATLGTTTGSDKPGVNLDVLAASDQLDESTVANAGSTAQFHSWGVDPDPTAADNSLLVTIQESQVWI